MKISERLAVIAGMVRYRSLADVGTDHAFLPIYLHKTGVIDKSAATDMNAGPLRRAEENIRLHGLGGVIETRLGSGLSVIKSHEFEVLVIAGVGGALIINILNGHLETAGSFKQILLQPQRNVGDVKAFLAGNGFAAVSETVITEKKREYTVLEILR
jgi:tRNA (adenine22-N1)-methyltransferase